MVLSLIGVPEVKKIMLLQILCQAQTSAVKCCVWDVCYAVKPAMDGVQQAMKDKVTSDAADLTKDNAALAALVAQLEQLQGAQVGNFPHDYQPLHLLSCT